VSCTFGNLAAYAQTNIKRLLAYSTIAHAGYMMMPVAAMLVLVKYDPRSAESAIAAISIYLTVYLFMNLGAFAIIAFLRNAMQTETIADYAGLIRRCPITVICFVLILFSLIGLPPLAGFIGKFAIFASLADGYRLSAAAGEPATFLLVLLVVGGLNTAISLFYYLRVAKVMTMDPEPEDRRPFMFSDVSLQGFYIWVLTLPTALLMLNWDALNRWAQAAAKYLLA
ncbi:MAG: proton-conducting transporter membrane subunit, partial [Pirellulaceae bacterium]|nr:proton-conducting transporter membrane subunit [Pirellulaceae bacterium]